MDLTMLSEVQLAAEARRQSILASSEENPDDAFWRAQGETALSEIDCEDEPATLLFNPVRMRP
jgi:hypothetical protein